jgi:hypothetical protein
MPETKATPCQNSSEVRGLQLNLAHLSRPLEFSHIQIAGNSKMEGKRAREEEEERKKSDGEKETNQSTKKAKLDAEPDEDKGKSEGGLRERLRRTCWVPAVEPAHQPAGDEGVLSADLTNSRVWAKLKFWGADEEEKAKRLAIEAPGFKFDHRTDLTCFGGVRPWLRHGEAWPRCGNGDCRQQMQFFLQVDFRFAPEEARQKFVGDSACSHRVNVAMQRLPDTCVCGVCGAACALCAVRCEQVAADVRLLGLRRRHGGALHQGGPASLRAAAAGRR